MEARGAEVVQIDVDCAHAHADGARSVAAHGASRERADAAARSSCAFELRGGGGARASSLVYWWCERMCWLHQMYGL